MILKNKFMLVMLLVIMCMFICATLIACDNNITDDVITESYTDAPTEAPTGNTTEPAVNVTTEASTQVPTDAVDEHKHDYSVKIEKQEYLFAPATCISPKMYNYACVCGEKGSATFSTGNADGANHTAPVKKEFEFVSDTAHKITTVCRDCNNVITEAEESHGEGCLLCKDAGFYDASYNLLASWYDLTDVYGMDIERIYEVNNTSSDKYYKSCGSSPYYLLNNVDAIRNTAVIVIPSSVSEIGSAAFYDCKNITSVVIKDSESELFSVSANSFAGCIALTDIVLPNTTKQIGDGAFARCYSLEKIVIPASVSRIEAGAFAQCVTLEDVYYEGALDEWMSLGFVSPSANPCSNGANLYINGTILTNLEIYDAAKIDAYSFYGCESIVSVSIPKSLRNIKAGAFMNCVNLESVIMHVDSVVNIENKAFYGCSSLETVVFSNTLIEIGEYAFYDCDSLEELTLVDNIELVERYAFAGCDKLKTVEFNISYKKFALDRTFVNCTSLRIINYNGTVEDWNEMRRYYEVIRDENGAVKKYVFWDDNTGDYTVICTDGTIAKDGTITKE